MAGDLLSWREPIWVVTFPLADYPSRTSPVVTETEGEKHGNPDSIQQMDQVQSETLQSGELSEAVKALSDQELIAEVLRKDRKATAEFVARCTGHVYGYVRRRLVPRADLVEDIVQETFLAAWENLDRFRGDSTLQGWLLGIARHKVEDHYRKRLKEIQFEDDGDGPDEVTVSLEDVEDGFSKRQAGKRAQQILATLPEIYSVVLLWRYWEKRSLREIAVETGKTEKAIERQLARARNEFRKKWNERQPTTRR
jgi:RNA polymerase sigma-70 factor, ECF subfamily